MTLLDDARVILNSDGTIADANDAALVLYGASLADLRSAPPGAFTANRQSPEAQAAFREAWEGEGRPDLVGDASLRRPDGSERRVAFGITRLEDGRFAAILRDLDAPTEREANIYTAGQVLAQWRAAERQLSEVAPESMEAAAINSEIDRFRQAYQRLFSSAGDLGRPSPGFE